MVHRRLRRSRNLQAPRRRIGVKAKGFFVGGTSRPRRIFGPVGPHFRNGDLLPAEAVEVGSRVFANEVHTRSPNFEQVVHGEGDQPPGNSNASTPGSNAYAPQQRAWTPSSTPHMSTSDPSRYSSQYFESGKRIPASLGPQSQSNSDISVLAASFADTGPPIDAIFTAGVKAASWQGNRLQ